MAKIKPFRAIRPAKGLEDKIAALPYDVYSSKEAREIVKGDQLSFLRIDRAETQFDESVDIYSDQVYQKAHDMLWDMVDRGEFIREQKPCYYIYELIWEGRAQDGIVACSSVDDYLNNIIKKHENTRADKELDRIRHIDTCDAQTGPIFLAYRHQDTIDEMVERVKKSTPVYDFTGTDGVTHRVWIVADAEDIDFVTNAFSSINEIYIADGHHRAASAVKVALKRRAANPDYTGSESFNRFLSVLFPDNQLKIMDYNRVVKDLNGYTEESFMEKIKELFDVTPEDMPVSPADKCSYGMFLKDQWYRLVLNEKMKKKAESFSVVEKLDVSVLQDYVLNPLLGIQDPKTDKRIDFVGGIRGLKELERRVNEGCAVAFSMYPTSMAELFDIADANLLMPPKSTWFEPKLRSGIFIHKI